MAEHLIQRLMEPVTSQVRDWLETRAQRAELNGLPASERANVLRELGLTEASVDRLAVHHGSDVLLPKRLDEFGLDAAGVERAHPATFRDLQRVCGGCPDWKTCRSEIDRADAKERLNAYCPNTHTIECLVAECGDEPAKA